MSTRKYKKTYLYASHQMDPKGILEIKKQQLRLYNRATTF